MSGRGGETGGELRPETREKILEGALAAVARHGLKKLGMNDVSDAAGVSRGTLYRYFPGKDDLMSALVVREKERFQRGLFETLLGVSDTEGRLLAVIEFAVRELHTHAALQRLRLSEAGLVLQTIREQYATIRSEVGLLIEPALAQTSPVALGLIRADQLSDWLMRMLVSMFLIPEPDPDEMVRGFQALYRVLTSSPAAAAGAETPVPHLETV